MRAHPKLIVRAGLIVAALGLGLGSAGPAGAAGAGHPARHENRPFYTTYVYGTAWPSNGLNIRNGPGTGYSIAGTIPHNGTVRVICYSTGTTINGNPYWDYVLNSPWGQGFVADYYLFTGGNIYDQVDGCH